MQENSINFFGPLSMEIAFTVKNALNLSNDMHIAKNAHISYGGNLLKIIRILHSLGYDQSQINGYVGSDSIGEKIIELLKEENIINSIQKLPNVNTPISLKIHNKKSFSKATTTPKDLSLWQMRLQHLKIKKKGIIFIDPSIPSEIQMNIIEEFKKSIIILRKPLDNNLEVFKCASKNVLILLNEYEAFQICTKTNFNYFSINEILKSNIFHNHKVLIETKNCISTFDNEKKIIKEVNITKNRKGYNVLNSAFLSGMIAALASKQSYETSFLWGIIASNKNFQNKVFSKIDITDSIDNFNWSIKKF